MIISKVVKRRVLIFVLCLVTGGGVGCGSVFSSSTKPSSKTSNYTVSRGDTLHQIAVRFKTSVSNLVRINRIVDPDLILPGTRLIVPATFGRVSKPSSPALYTGGQLLWPVAGGELVSSFGPRRGSFHDGLDIAAPNGTPVYAAHDGEVAYSANELGGYGEIIILKSSSSLVSVYAHNSRRYVKVGQRVRRGERIALVGATGKAEGPHLHFEVRVKDSSQRYVAVDPTPLLQNTPKPSLRYRVNESLSPIIARLKATKLIDY